MRRFTEDMKTIPSRFFENIMSAGLSEKIGVTVDLEGHVIAAGDSCLVSACHSDGSDRPTVGLFGLLGDSPVARIFPRCFQNSQRGMKEKTPPLRPLPRGDI